MSARLDLRQSISPDHSRPLCLGPVRDLLRNKQSRANSHDDPVTYLIDVQLSTARIVRHQPGVLPVALLRLVTGMARERIQLAFLTNLDWSQTDAGQRMFSLASIPVDVLE